MVSTQRKNKKFWEFGATKLEVVAVFFVIIILAITAILCYYLILDKNKAENILNQANQRALVVSTQIQENRPLSLSEFTEENEFFLGAQKINKSQFQLTLSQPEPKVCQQIKEIITGSALIQGTNNNCTELYYNIDLNEKKSPVCQAGNYLKDNQCTPCEAGDKTCECHENTPYADGKGGCCHYVANYSDTHFSSQLDDICCAAEFDIAIDSHCTNQNQLYD